MEHHVSVGRRSRHRFPFIASSQSYDKQRRQTSEPVYAQLQTNNDNILYCLYLTAFLISPSTLVKLLVFEIKFFVCTVTARVASAVFHKNIERGRGLCHCIFCVKIERGGSCVCLSVAGAGSANISLQGHVRARKRWKRLSSSVKTTPRQECFAPGRPEFAVQKSADLWGLLWSHAGDSPGSPLGDSKHRAGL